VRLLHLVAQGELRVGFGERLVEHQLRENWSAVGAFGASQAEVHRTREENAVNDGLLFMRTNWA